MEKEIIISATRQETRVALMENKLLSEFYHESVRDRRIAGSVYKGRVSRVLPGMQAAFVDIGLEKAAFLYVSDVEGQGREYSEIEFEDEREPETEVPFKKRASAPIETLLTESQLITAQVAKEPLGRKGARITQHISLPGRNIVYLPNVDHVGVSRRIEDEKERQRLKELVEKLKGENPGGYIVRTVSAGCKEEELRPEMDFLRRLWEEISKKSAFQAAPSLLHSDLDLISRSIRDLYTPSVRRIVVDSPDEYREILDFVNTFVPQAASAVELYTRPEPIFDFYGIEIELSRAMEKRVWLKSGGYIVIEMTEALTAIDVNTGSFVGKRNLEETILKTNLEAAKEIAYQLRLRNIGGIIIIDFIDMEHEENRLKVFETFRTEFEKDRAKTNLLQISSLGLVEMTRKRVGENLGRSLSEACPYCDGTGMVRSKSTVAAEIFRDLRRKRNLITGEDVVVEANKDVVQFIFEEERADLEMLEQALGVHITLKARKDFHREEYEIAGV
ncbi:Rne/Rng family ribonuclease [bacterium]|nr:MAG: Rne/Rng family ribonuclease [bacterium]